MQTIPAPAPSVGIADVAYHLPGNSLSLEELAARGALRTPAATLSAFGFRRAYIAEDASGLDMARAVAAELLERSGADPAEIGLLIHAGALASSSTIAPDGPPGGPALHLPHLMDLFAFPVSRLQAELGLTRAAAVGVGQQACASLFSAIRMGRAMLATEEELEMVLCVAADRFPTGASREMTYNVVSDAACAVLLRKGWASNRIIACGHITKGALWNAAELEHEIVAAYFPTARTVIEDTLGRAGLTLDDIDWIVPHNVSLRSWEILLGLLGVPREKLYAENIARVGHTIAADNFLNLRDLLDSGRVRPGERLLLFTFGYGLNWSCIVVEH